MNLFLRNKITTADSKFFLISLVAYLFICPIVQSSDTWEPGWTWISGSDTGGQLGVYGTKGIPDSTNVPGARIGSVSWTDADGNLWLFGGFGSVIGIGGGELNDLWKFDGANWTWVSGSETKNQLGVYGTKGVADTANVPGARSNSASWIDADGNLWLFGGWGYDSGGELGVGSLNDMWKFDGANWTWISGSEIMNQPGVYGTKGVTDPSNVPEAKWKCVSWIDADGSLWLFGGYGGSRPWELPERNDLWKFDGSNWTWISGSDIGSQPGVYGTKGVADPANVPGARIDSVSWTDTDGNLWLFGGYGFGVGLPSGLLNDLWKFDGTNWTWISGSPVPHQYGNYGTKSVADPANVPGARYRSVSWTDNDGSLWLFGGMGFFNLFDTGALNDLWKFDGDNWTWISGSSTPPTQFNNNHGIIGITDAANMPGGRADSVSWIGTDGSLWLFGGESDLGFQGFFNDLWRFRGCLPPLGDLNGDCRVNNIDLAILASHWLDDTNLY